MSHVSLTSPKLRSSRTLSALLTLCAASTLSCTSLDGFNSKEGQAYCGPIGLALTCESGPCPGFHDGFVKDGSPSDLDMALKMNMSKLNSVPGTLTSNNPQGLCGTPEAPQVLFQDAQVRAIPEVDHDVLSALTFGEGHDHDFFAWVDSTCQGTMLAVVSLMKNNYIELRLFKPASYPPPNATAAQRPGFALWHLNPKPLALPEKEGGCGFPASP